jgi:hypothetical protein
MSNTQLQYKRPEESELKLKPSIHDPNATAHSYWCAVVTRLNGRQDLVSDFEHNVFPSGCVDQIHNTAFTNTSNTGTRGFGCIALTADATQAVNSAQTALTGEITTNGLARADAVTKTHVTGTNTSLIEHTFTLTGAQSDITRAALFNIATAPVSGTMGPFAAFSTSTGPMASGETLKVSITITTS